MKQVLSRRPADAGIALQWVLFGTSGHLQRPTAAPGTLRHYTRCSGQLSTYMKCLARPRELAADVVVPFRKPQHSCVYRCVHPCACAVQAVSRPLLCYKWTSGVL